MAYVKKEIGLISVAALAAMLAWAPPALAGGDDPVLDRIDQLEAELEALREAVRENREAADEARVIAREADRTASNVYSDLNTDTSWHLSGYTAVGFQYSDEADPNSTFVFGKINPIFHFQYKDWVMAEAEIEFEMDGSATEVTLEYATIDFFVNDYVTLMFGKFWNPTTIFNSRVHPSWINRLVSGPVGWGDIAPRTDVGAMVHVAVPVGSTRLDLALAVGNGHRLTEEGINLRGSATDDNENKSFSGRLGFLPIPSIEVGASFMVQEVESFDHEEEVAITGDFDIYAADAAYVQGPWRIRGEYLHAELSGFGHGEEEEGEHHGEILRSIIPLDGGGGGEDLDFEPLAQDAEWQAWYVEVAYRMSGLTEDRYLRNFEPVVRYGEYDVEGTHEMEEASENRLSFGLNYWFAPSIVAHGVVQLRDFVDDDRDDETVLQLQLAYGF